MVIEDQSLSRLFTPSTDLEHTGKQEPKVSLCVSVCGLLPLKGCDELRLMEC